MTGHYPPIAAYAQGSGQAPDEDGTSGIAEIIVTAQKKSENLQNVPISISAITGDFITDRNATSLQGLQGTIPNVQIGNFTNTPNNAAFSIRGIGVIESDPFAGNTVSIVVDGVPQYFSYGALLDLFDVQRVEALRGPQGTLFGANTTGGAINVVTEQPTGTFGGNAQITYGNYNRLDVKAAVDLPIVPDLLAAKVAVMHTGRDGYFTNVYTGGKAGKRNVTGIRGYLKFTPSPDIDATLIGEYSRGRNGAPAIANGGLATDVIYVAAGTTTPQSALPMYAGPCPSITARCKAPDKYLTANDSVPDISNIDTRRLTFTLNWRNTPIGDITAITGYKNFKLVEFTDQDATILNLLNTDRETKGWQFSQELRTTFDIGDRMNFLLGGFYMKTHYDHFMNLTLDFALPGFRQFNTQDQDNYSISGFAQGYFDITDKLRLQAGIRYTHEQTEMTAGLDNFLNPDGPALLFARKVDAPDIPLGGFVVSGKKSWNNVGWKVGLDYKATNALLLYGYWARGFKSGGFVGRITIPQDIGPYNPEKVDTFEAGIKADWFDRRLRTNISAFYTNYRNMQVAQTYLFFDDMGNAVQGVTIFNAAKSTLKGMELETTAIPVDGLTLTANIAYLDASYDKFDYFDPVDGVINLKGYKLQNAPKWTTSLSAKYDFAAAGGMASIFVDYNYSASKFYSALRNTPRSRIQPTHYVNANLEWSPDGRDWTIGLWANNLFDKRYILSVVDQPGLYDNVGYGAPREFGGTLKFKW